MSYGPEWVLVEELAKSPRPGYPVGQESLREIGTAVSYTHLTLPTILLV